MKRSEATKFITDILFYGKLAESARSDIRPKCTTELAEADACAVLKELEKLGMSLKSKDKTFKVNAKSLVHIGWL